MFAMGGTYVCVLSLLGDIPYSMILPQSLVGRQVVVQRMPRSIFRDYVDAMQQDVTQRQDRLGTAELK